MVSRGRYGVRTSPNPASILFLFPPLETPFTMGLSPFSNVRRVERASRHPGGMFFLFPPLHSPFN